jgi:hypothetical protein
MCIDMIPPFRDVHKRNLFSNSQTKISSTKYNGFLKCIAIQAVRIIKQKKREIALSTAELYLQQINLNILCTEMEIHEENKW